MAQELIILVHFEDDDDEKQASRVLTLLKGTPGIRPISYRDILPGEAVADEQKRLYNEAHAVLWLMSASFMASDRHMNEASMIVRGRGDLLAAKRMFLLIIKPMIWDAGYLNSNIATLLRGRWIKKGVDYIQAIQEMIGMINMRLKNQALPEPGVIEGDVEYH